jgi:hypothetical protein
VVVVLLTGPELAYLRDVAAHYAAAPTHDKGIQATRAWRDLADETMATAARLRDTLDVRYTPDPEPYPTAYEMLRDIAQGRVVVSIANSLHPVWTLEENTAFRLVHDVVGHGATGSGFDWYGECRAYDKHWSIVVSPWARAALFTEAVGQVAYALVHGGFTVQKVALLPQWMQWHRAQGGGVDGAVAA